MSQRIVILGAGESGTGAALLAKAKGFDVFVSDFGSIAAKYKKQLDKEKIQFEEKQHSEELILTADLVIKSPGIPSTAPIVVQIKEKGIDIISEIEFGYRYSNAQFIAITGSNGKTTTTLLTHHLLKSAGFNVGLAGNIGDSLARQLVDGDKDFFVLELSSFQLDDMYDFKAHIAVLVNITPDHLDRYNNDFSQYVDSKFRVAQNMTNDDYFISYTDDTVINKELVKRDIDAFKLNVSLDNRMLNGAYMGHDALYFNIDNHITSIFSVDLKYSNLTGKHNMINTMCAVLAARTAGVKENVIVKALGSFKNAPHRLEFVNMINGVKYINDSKATNVDATKFALDTFERPIIWIAGGVDKGNDYEVLKEPAYEKVVALICLGKDNEKLKEQFEGVIPMILETEEMTQAIKLANEIANQEGVVLLSPACASFDLFKNYEDRGDQFKAAVKTLIKTPKFNFITL